MLDRTALPLAALGLALPLACFNAPQSSDLFPCDAGVGWCNSSGVPVDPGSSGGGSGSTRGVTGASSSGGTGSTGASSGSESSSGGSTGSAHGTTSGGATGSATGSGSSATSGGSSGASGGAGGSTASGGASSSGGSSSGSSSGSSGSGSGGSTTGGASSSGGGGSTSGGACGSASGARTLVASAKILNSIAVSGGNLYWYDESASQLESVPVGGGTPSPLASGDHNVTGLVADAQYVYWATNQYAGGDATVKREPLAGGVSPTVLTGGLLYPNSICADANNIYVANGGTCGSLCNSDASVWAVSKTAGGYKVLASNQIVAGFYCAVDSRNVYWTNYATNTAQTAQVSEVAVSGNGSASVLVPTVPSQVSGLVSDGTALYWLGQDGQVHAVTVSTGASTVIGTIPTSARWLVLGGSTLYAASSAGIYSLPTSGAGGAQQVVADSVNLSVRPAVDACSVYYQASSGALRAAPLLAAVASAPDAGPLAPMPTPRAYTGAALGPDGRIYVVGGVGDGGYFVATAEAYDPAANQWTELAPMPSPTSNMGATFGPDGLLYAVGGLVGISVGCGTPGPYYESSQVEAYDPATDQWVSKPSMANARNYPGVVTGPDGRIYAAGGWSGGANLANAEAYDVDAGTWKPIASMSTGRTVAGYAVGLGAGGLFYMLGGQNGGPPLYTAEAYSCETNAWTGLTSLPGSGQCFGWGIEGAALGPDGRLYAIGVCTGTTNSSMFSYDPSSGYNGSWSGAASVPAGVYQGFGVATKPGPNGRIYVFGGMNSASSNCSVNANVVAYDPASGTWSNWAP